MIFWKQDERTFQRKCQEWGRCTIAFKREIRGNDIASIEFKAVTRETNIKLELNSLPAIKVKPSHYREIVEAVLDYPGMQEANLFLAPGYCHRLDLLSWCKKVRNIYSLAITTKLLFHYSLSYVALEAIHEGRPSLGEGERGREEGEFDEVG